MPYQNPEWITQSTGHINVLEEQPNSGNWWGSNQTPFNGFGGFEQFKEKGNNFMGVPYPEGFMRYSGSGLGYLSGFGYFLGALGIGAGLGAGLYSLGWILPRNNTGFSPFFW